VQEGVRRHGFDGGCGVMAAQTGLGELRMGGLGRGSQALGGGSQLLKMLFGKSPDGSRQMRRLQVVHAICRACHYSTVASL
jgi:hypothetical protein